MSEIARMATRLAFSISFALMLITVGKPVEARKKKLAVIELSNFVEDQVTDYEARYLTDVIRKQALPIGGRFDIMTRENITDMLPPDVNLARCEESSQCEVELGRKIGADYVVTGEIMLYSTDLKVTMSMYDTHSSNLLSSETATAGNVRGLETEVTTAAKRIFRALERGGPSGRWLTAGGRVTVTEFDLDDEDLGKKIRNPIVDETGFIFVESEPSGATVLINGEEKGATPYQAELMVGVYVVTCKKGALYLPARERIEIGTKGAKISMTLEPHFGHLNVTSDPPGANIAINGEPTGKKTPFVFRKKRSGVYRVELTKKLYLSKTTKAELGGGKESEIKVTLEANFGSIFVDSSPQGAQVLLDGNPTGQITPARLEKVVTGLHQVEVRSAQYHSKKKRVTVRSADEAQVSLPLTGKFGMLIVTATVVDEGMKTPVDADVWVNGRKLEQTTPLKDKYLVGDYKLRVKAPEAAVFEKTIAVEESKKTHVEAELSKLLPEEILAERRALKRAAFDEALVKSKKDRKGYVASGVVLIPAGAIGVVAGALLLGVVSLRAQEERDTAYNNWAEAEEINEVDKYQDQIVEQDDRARAANVSGWIALSAGIAMAATGIVILAVAPDKPVISEYMTPEDIEAEMLSFSVSPMINPGANGAFGLSLSGIF